MDPTPSNSNYNPAGFNDQMSFQSGRSTTSKMSYSEIRKNRKAGGRSAAKKAYIMNSSSRMET
jgi:hypothetical protein